MYLTITSAANKSYQSSCNTSNITFAFRPNKGKYSLSVSILDEENPAKMKSWWKVDNITITPNSCGSTVLKN